MKLAVREALKGSGNVSPNPLVGAVVVKNGNIIGKGYHKIYGGPHAEINALDNCTESPAGADLYVNLEPCAHHGKTSPCTQRIIAERISNVYIGSPDPSDHCCGKGVRELRDAKIQVHNDILRSECDMVNAVFFHCLKNKTPYVVLKAAVSLDGYMATVKNDSKWISCEKSRKEAHRLRSIYDSVLVGKNTVLNDDPELTVRFVKGKNPVRIATDETLSLDGHHRIFNRLAPTVIITGKNVPHDKETFLKGKGIKIINADIHNGLLDLKTALKELYREGIMSVMVEGGGQIHSYMLKNRMAQRMALFLSPILIGGGIKLFDGKTDLIKESIRLETVSKRNFDEDIFLDLIVRYSS